MKKYKTSTFSWILILICFLVYLRVMGNGFVWDDEELIVNNQFVRSLKYIGKMFSGSFFGSGGALTPSGGYYRPLVSVWYSLNFAVFKLNAWGYHLMHVLLHGVNVVLLFRIFERLTNKRKMAFLGALVFAVHSVNVEAVAYLASAHVLLSSFFMLLSLWMLMKENIQRRRIQISAGLMLLALLCYEGALVGSVLGGVYLWLFYKDKRHWQDWLVYMVLVGFIYGLLRFAVAGLGLGSGEIFPIAGASFRERMLTVPYVLFSHVRTMFWPKVLYIANHRVIREFSGQVLVWLGVFLGVVAAMGRLVWKRKSKQMIFFGSWFIMSVLLVSNVVALDMTYAERWTYFPLMGMIGFLVVGMGKLNRVKLLVIIGVVLALSLRTWVRVGDWHDGLRLYSADILYANESFDLQNNLGVELFRLGKMEEAKPYFEESIRLNPKWWTAYNNLGVYYQRAGNTEQAKRLYGLSIKNGDYFLAWENLASIKVKEEDEDAVEFVMEGLRRLPNNQILRRLWLVVNN